MDKKIFLLDKDCYKEDIISSLTEKDLEEWVAEEDYNGNYTIIKIDANEYETPQEALKEEHIAFPEEYYQIVFGFEELSYTNYEVLTSYKSGKKRTDIISATSESEMWAIYDKHHTKSIIQSAVIVDAWLS